MSDANVIQLSDVVVDYSNGVRALDQISLEVSKEDIVGLIGPNGAGKSTLLGVMLGLIKPNSGTVRLFGEPIAPKNLRRIGYVPQNLQTTNAFPATVQETVLLGRVPRVGVFHRLGRPDLTDVEHAMEHLDITTLRNRKLSQLSGGQLQRVLVAKALAAEPEILILDEPTSGVDAHLKTEFYTLLSRLNREHQITIILSSHDVGTVTKLANKVVCVNRSLFYCGLTSEFNDAVLAKTYDYSVSVIQHGSHA